MDANALRQMGDFLRDKAPDVVAVLASANGEKITFLASLRSRGGEARHQGRRLVKSVCAICGGKGGGIGYGLSTAFAKEGCNLVITGRNTKKLDDAKEELERLYGVKVLACQPMAAWRSRWPPWFSRRQTPWAASTFNQQRPELGLRRPLAEHTKEQFDQAIYSGLYAAFFYMKHCYPYLKETKGSVVNFASGAGLFGKPGQSSYAAAKEGIRGMTRVAATEWAPTASTATSFAPW